MSKGDKLEDKSQFITVMGFVVEVNSDVNNGEGFNVSENKIATAAIG